MQQFSSQKKFLAALGALLIVGLALQQYVLRFSPGKPSPSPRPEATNERILVKADTGGWKEYANEKLGFSVRYPEQISVRGTAESDLAILTLPIAETEGKQALITLTKKKVPLGQAPYADMQTFWKDEQRFIAANNGVISNARTVELNGRAFWEAHEDNRQNNYMGLHRYLKQGTTIYEATLTVEGEKLLESAVELYNNTLSTLTVK